MRSKKRLFLIVVSLELLTMSIKANYLEQKDENFIKKLMNKTLEYQKLLQKNKNIKLIFNNINNYLISRQNVQKYYFI